jgi:hypothetical protein
MADGLFYNDLREPFTASDIAAVTLAATNKALYPASNFPLLGGHYFARPGKKLHIRLFGRITTVLTPGNLTFGVYYGTGADANGVLLASTTAQALIASQTNLSWQADVFVHCRSIGSAGTLFVTGRIKFNEAVAAPEILLPGSAPVVSGACDLTAALIISVQAARSGSSAETMQVHDMEAISLN